MISAGSYVKQIAAKCNRIAGELSDADGFISVRGLLDRFGVNLLVRPLLVEGMLASTEQNTNEPDGTKAHRWCLLLDQETHNLDETEISGERFGSPLSARLRNTVAHELAHSLAFRAAEFGVEFPTHFSSQKTKQEFVQAIERDTEKLSPLLLLPDILLDRMLSAEKETVSIGDLSLAMRNAGVSRYVFVNRFKLLELIDPKGLRSRISLCNVAIGLGEWSSEQQATLNSWPLFSNFEGGRVPGFLFQLQRRIPVPANGLFSDSGFYLCGGESQTMETTVLAGTPRNPDSLRLPIRLSVERVPRVNGAEFLFLIQSRQPG